jgi:hypothetical protein
MSLTSRWQKPVSTISFELVLWLVAKMQSQNSEIVGTFGH